MKNSNIKNFINKKRILTNIIDFFIFFPWVFPLLPILIEDTINSQIINNLLIIFLPLFFIVYFGVVVRIANGYTLGGLITKTRIINIGEGNISAIQYATRVLSAIWDTLKSFISGSKEMNGIGQYSYDEKFNTTVLPDSISIKNLDKKIIYRYHYFFDIFIIYIKYSFGFIFVLGIFITILQNITN